MKQKSLNIIFIHGKGHHFAPINKLRNTPIPSRNDKLVRKGQQFTIVNMIILIGITNYSKEITVFSTFQPKEI